MPYKPKHPCKHPGCPELVASDQKYCENHLPLHAEEYKDKRQGGSAARGYGWKWQKACLECYKDNNRDGLECYKIILHESLEWYPNPCQHSGQCHKDSYHQ